MKKTVMLTAVATALTVSALMPGPAMAADPPSADKGANGQELQRLLAENAKLKTTLQERDKEVAALKEQLGSLRAGPAATEAATQPAGQGHGSYPWIGGVWQEGPDVFIAVTQTGGTWRAQCSYTHPDAGEVRWEMDGTISHDGLMRGTLRHTKAPTGWKATQIREGRLSGGESVIAGTAKWEGGEPNRLPSK